MFKPTPERRCTKCGRFLPATEEYFYRNENGKYNTSSACKQCLCKANKTNEMHAYARNWYKEHGDIKREKRRKRYAALSLTEREKLNKAQRDAYAQLTDIQKQKRYQKKLEYVANMSEKEKERYHKLKLIAAIKRRSLKLISHTKYTDSDIENLFKQSGGWCWYCDGPANLNGHRYHIDHMIPLSHGGEDSLDNLVISCYKCNESKGNKSLDEWKGPEQYAN